MICRTASVDEVALMLDWAAAEGWNPGVDDAAAFHATDPEGFFVAEEDGAPVAAISVANHSDAFAFLGLYLCLPDFRGQGIGYALWNHALEHAGNRTVGLDGVAAQEANYATSGFVRTGATKRFVGMLAPRPYANHHNGSAAELSVFLGTLDSTANGINRPAFLKAWLAPSDTRRTLIQPGTGFATARLCRIGAKLGPIIAPDAEAALTLGAAALAEIAEGPTEVAIDLPEANTDLADRLAAMGFENTFTTARMYRGPAPVTGPGLQAIATMELG